MFVLKTMQEDFYFTIQSALRAPDLRVKGSRFIANIFPVANKEEIEQSLDSIRKEFHDARHHSFAYRLGIDGKLLRAADDGEPNGTAGRPILLVLSGQKLTNVLLIVTRYFGGTKLGTGGLARAYAEAAQQAVSMSKIVRVYLTTSIEVQIRYEDLPQMERLVAAFEGQIEESTYLDSVTLRVALRRSMVEQFIHSVTDTFHGRANAYPRPVDDRSSTENPFQP
jgi:uncharacterized YigZ family protein